MGDRLYHLPVGWMAVVIFTSIYVGTWAIHAALTKFIGGARGAKFRRIAPGMLSPLGTVFGLLAGFLAVQVWNDSQRAHDAVNREASALRAVVILAPTLSDASDARIRALLARHIQEVTTAEWVAMSRQNATIATIPVALAEALQVTVADTPKSEGERIAQHEIVRSLEDALAARRERIIISRSSIGWVKWSGLMLQAFLVLVTIGLVHCDHRDTAAIGMGIFATAVATSALLIASHARPFTGEISVAPDVLREVMPPPTTVHP